MFRAGGSEITGMAASEGTSCHTSKASSAPTFALRASVPKETAPYLRGRPSQVPMRPPKAQAGSEPPKVEGRTA